MRYQKGKVKKKKKILLKIIFKNLGINLTKEVKDIYTENYKTLIIKDDSKKWKDIPYSWIERINTTHTTYRFNVIPIKLPMTFFHRTRTNNLKFTWNYKRPFPDFPWCLRWQRICLQCRRPRFNPWVRKIPWRMAILSHILAWRIPWRRAWWATVHGVAGRTQLLNNT